MLTSICFSFSCSDVADVAQVLANITYLTCFAEIFADITHLLTDFACLLSCISRV